MSLSPLKYHSNSGPTSSCSSATHPSTDTTACITTVPTVPPSRRVCSSRLTTTDLDSHRSTDRQAVPTCTSGLEVAYAKRGDYDGRTHPPRVRRTDSCRSHQ